MGGGGGRCLVLFVFVGNLSIFKSNALLGRLIYAPKGAGIRHGTGHA